MTRPKIDEWMNLDDPNVRRNLLNRIASMNGIYEVSLKPRRNTRSSRANRYYWGVVVQAFYDFLRDQEETVTDAEMAHVELKRSILGTKAVALRGGITARILKTTHDMDSAQFADYIERARTWLASKLDIQTPDPGEMNLEYRKEQTP